MTPTREELQQLLPRDCSWGDSLTPERLLVILRNYEDRITTNRIESQKRIDIRPIPEPVTFRPLELLEYPSVYPTQDPKYVIVNNRLTNAQSMEPIPLDEGVFIYRFKDRDFVPTLEYYLSRLRNPEHIAAVASRRDAAVRFAQTQPWRMKEADTHATPQMLYAP